MKKQIQTGKNLLSQFQSSELLALATVSGGAAAPKTSTIMYSTSSSAEDQDIGDHDADY